MKIIGIDSGIEKTGFSVFEIKKETILFHTSGIIQTSSKLSLEKRLSKLYQQVLDLFTTYKPSTMAVERLFFHKNQKTAITVAQAQGVTILAGAVSKISIEFITPLQIKQIVTGYGLSDKKSVAKMLSLQLKLPKAVYIDDELDAIACGFSFCHLTKSKLR